MTTTKPAKLTFAAIYRDENIADVCAMAVEVWNQYGILPGKAKKYRGSVDAIATWAGEHGLTTLGELTGDTASLMLCHLAGAPSITSTRRAKKLHLHRNVLLALRALPLYVNPTVSRAKNERAADDTLAEGLAPLPALSDLDARPLTDAEVLVLRSLILIDLHEKANARITLATILAEEGVDATPSTTLTIDSIAADGTLTVPGLWGWKERAIVLDSFNLAAMGRAASQLTGSSNHLTYTGTAPGTRKACASIAGVLKRARLRAGINAPDLTYASHVAWRLHHVLRGPEGLRGSRMLHGGTAESLYTTLNLEADTSTTMFTGAIELRDRATNKVIATVPAHHAA